jgi:hypothetical protein
MATLADKWAQLIQGFLADLTRIPNLPLLASLCLQGTSYFVNMADPETLVMPLYRFVDKYKDRLQAKDDSLFTNFEAKTGAIRHLLNATGQLWPLLSAEDREAVWKWFAAMADLHLQGQPEF